MSSTLTSLYIPGYLLYFVSSFVISLLLLIEFVEKEDFINNINESEVENCNLTAIELGGLVQTFFGFYTFGLFFATLTLLIVFLTNEKNEYLCCPGAFLMIYLMFKTFLPLIMLFTLLNSIGCFSSEESLGLKGFYLKTIFLIVLEFVYVASVIGFLKCTCTCDGGTSDPNDPENNYSYDDYDDY